MKYFVPILFGLSFVFACSNAIAQRNVGPLKLDPSFANNGKSEIDFEGFNDDATCFVVNVALNRILAAGKIYTSTPGEIHFGVVEYDANGTLQSVFGAGGKADLSWNGMDYPNAIDLLPDGSILGAGATGVFTFGQFGVAPTFFRLKPNGLPDSSFGTSGIVVGFSGGEFESIDTFSLISRGDTSERYLATGYGSNVDSDLQPVGFCAERLTSSGAPDSTFGSAGEEFVEAPIRMAQGHLVEGEGILFAGVGTGQYPEIILCKLLPNGTPDSSFGTNGVLNTGITLHAGNWLQSVYDQSTFDTFPGLLVAVPLSDSSAMLPFTIIKFKLNGTLDSNYGLNGIATAPVISNMKIYGMTPPNSRGYTHLCGSIGNVSATVQFLPGGTVDSTFGTNGIALMDADDGFSKNFLIGFTPVSKQFIGIGTSVNANGNDDFLVTRYIPGVAGVSPAKSDNSKAMQLFPNPAHGFVQVGVSNNPIEQISIVDALGRIVLSFERPSYASNSNSYFLDVSNIPNGTYHCTVRTAAGISSQRFTVIH